MKNKLVINQKTLEILIYLYVFCIVIFDYTIMYKVVIMLLIICDLLLYKSSKLKITPLCKMNFLLIIYFLIHTLLGGSVSDNFSYTYLATMVMNLIICMITEKELKNVEIIENIMKAMICTSVCACIYVIWQDRANLLTGHLGATVLKPFFHTGYSHNDISMAVAYSTMFISYFEVSGKKVRFSNILKALFTVFVILTGARKSLLLVLVALFVYPYIFSYKDRNISKKIVKVFFCFAGILIAFIIIMKNETLYNVIGYRFEGVFAGITGEEYTESSAVSRSVMIKTAFRLFLDKPLTGWGLNTFRTFEGSYGTWSHNNYLELAVSGGIIAPIIYYSFFVYVFINLLKIKKNPFLGMLISLMLFMILHDYLSISYISRMTIFILGIVDMYIINQKEGEK